MNPFLEIENSSERSIYLGFILGFIFGFSTSQKAFKETFNISKSEFYRSFSKLKNKGLIPITVPQLGQIVPQLGQIVPQLGQIVPQLGQIVPQLGQTVPQLGQTVPQLGLSAESAVNQLTNLISSQQTIGNLANEELRKRIDLLEQQNTFLMQLLKQQVIPVTPPAYSQPPQIITDSPSVSGSFFGSARKPSFPKQQQETAPADNSPQDELPTGKTKYRGTTENLLDQIPKQYEEAFRSAMQEIIDHLIKISRNHPRLVDKLDYRKISPAIFHRLVFLRVRYMAGERNLALSEIDWNAMVNDDCKATLNETRIKFIGSAFLKTLQEFYIRENWEWTAVSPPSVEFKQEKYLARLHNRLPRVWAFPNENTRQKEQKRNEEPELFAMRRANQATAPPAEPQPPKYVEVVAQIAEKEKQDEQTAPEKPAERSPLGGIQTAAIPAEHGHNGKYANAPRFTKLLVKNPIAERKQRENETRREPDSGGKRTLHPQNPQRTETPEPACASPPVIEKPPKTFTFAGKEYRYDVLTVQEFEVIFREVGKDRNELEKAVRYAVVAKTNTERSSQ